MFTAVQFFGFLTHLKKNNFARSPGFCTFVLCFTFLHSFAYVLCKFFKFNVLPVLFFKPFVILSKSTVSHNFWSLGHPSMSPLNFNLICHPSRSLIQVTPLGHLLKSSLQVTHLGYPSIFQLQVTPLVHLPRSLFQVTPFMSPLQVTHLGHPSRLTL